jgi:hypothetical protein
MSLHTHDQFTTEPYRVIDPKDTFFLFPKICTGLSEVLEDPDSTDLEERHILWSDIGKKGLNGVRCNIYL